MLAPLSPQTQKETKGWGHHVVDSMAKPPGRQGCLAGTSCTACRALPQAECGRMHCFKQHSQLALGGIWRHRQMLNEPRKPAAAALYGHQRDSSLDCFLAAFFSSSSSSTSPGQELWRTGKGWDLRKVMEAAAVPRQAGGELVRAVTANPQALEQRVAVDLLPAAAAGDSSFLGMTRRCSRPCSMGL